VGADHRVVGAGLDRAVVDEEGVRDPGQPLQRVFVTVGDRLIRNVPAGHHEGLADHAEQEMVKRRVRQHHAELRRAGRHRLRDGDVHAARREDDRSRGRFEERSGLLLELHELLHGVKVTGHQRERLVLTMLSGAHRRDRALLVGEAGQVIAADPLEGEDAPAGQRARRALQRIAAGFIAEQRHLRAADGTCVRLGVEAAIERVLVLAPAFAAHLEVGHRRERPVVWDTANDREARAAVGAVDERVAKTAVRRVEQLAKAVCACGRVSRDRGVGPPAARTCPDLELLGPEAAQEVPYRILVALHLEQDTLRVVEHVTGELQLVREAVDVRSEAHALNRPLDAHPVADAFDGDALWRGRAHPTNSLSTWYALACASWIRGMCSERVTTTWSASRSLAIRPPS
jgi:hypothetical protein